VDTSNGYFKIWVDYKRYPAHRLAWLYVHGQFPAGDIDHKNHNRADCRIANLRLATNSQNGANAKMPRTNSTGFKGVSWKKQTKKYVAAIVFRGKRVHLKYCATAKEAALCYDYVAGRVFGEFAMTNKQLGLV
jgi:hypothetical protein